MNNKNQKLKYLPRTFLLLFCPPQCLCSSQLWPWQYSFQFSLGKRLSIQGEELSEHNIIVPRYNLKNSSRPSQFSSTLTASMKSSVRPALLLLWLSLQAVINISLSKQLLWTSNSWLQWVTRQTEAGKIYKSEIRTITIVTRQFTTRCHNTPVLLPTFQLKQ